MTTIQDIDFDLLWQTCSSHFTLGLNSAHGPRHWQNVLDNGLLLCEHNGADEIVVRLFAVFHDVERENENTDPEHGHRAADFIESIHGNLFTVDDARLESLLDACRGHNGGATSDDLTIGTCWDADRMDLPRVGVDPIAELMSTRLGKRFVYEGRDAFEP